VKLSLYELTNQYRALLDLADSDDLPQEVIRDTLEGLAGSIEDKAVAVAKFIRNLEVHADAIDVCAANMNQRANRIRKRAERVRAYLLFNMQAASVTKVECPEFVITRRENPPAVCLREGVELPAEFMVTPEPPPPKPDKKKLADALKRGEQIDGAWLERGERLDIKV
jgi:Siphovirus Gp157